MGVKCWFPEPLDACPKPWALYTPAVLQIKYFTSFALMSSAWKQTASFWEQQRVLLDTELCIFFHFHFSETVSLASKFQSWVWSRWNFLLGLFCFLMRQSPHIATPSLGIWVPCCLFSFLSLELLSTATSHRAARTRLLLEAKGDREKWQTSKWQHRFLWRGLRSPHIWVSKIQITFFLFENSHMQIIPNLSREDGKDKT